MPYLEEDKTAQSPGHALPIHGKAEMEHGYRAVHRQPKGSSVRSVRRRDAGGA